MEKPALPESVEIFVNHLQKVTGIDAIILFGSYAKGTQKDRSDIDIAIIRKTSQSLSSLCEEAGMHEPGQVDLVLLIGYRFPCNSGY